MLFLTPLFDGLPQATLAAIIIAAVIGLVDVKGLPAAVADRPGRREARDRRVRRRCAPRRPAGDRDRRRGVAAGADPACLPAPDRRARPRDRRDERGRGLPVPRHRPPSGVRDDSRARPVPVLERALLRQRRRTSATRRYGSSPTSDPPARTVLVDASAISHVDTTALAMLEDLIDRLDARGVTFELARVPRDARGHPRPRPGSTSGSGPSGGTVPCTPACRRSSRGPRSCSDSSVRSPGWSTRTSVVGEPARCTASSNSAGGVVRKPGGPRSPRWIGVVRAPVDRDREPGPEQRRRLGRALPGSMWPGPIVGPQPQIGSSATSTGAELGHPGEDVGVAGEVDRAAAALDHVAERLGAGAERQPRRSRARRGVARTVTAPIWISSPALSSSTFLTPALRLISAPAPRGATTGISRPSRCSDGRSRWS